MTGGYIGKNCLDGSLAQRYQLSAPLQQPKMQVPKNAGRAATCRFFMVEPREQVAEPHLECGLVEVMTWCFVLVMGRVTKTNFRADRYYPAVAAAFGAILKRSEVVGTIDVLVEMGKLTPKNVEDWRFGRIPFLERAITGNLSKASRIVRVIHLHAAAANLRPSITVYNRWGKGPKRRLRFTKWGDVNLEKAYSTCFVRTPRPAASPASASGEIGSE